jgi:anti-anti-sigma factor
MLSFTIHDLGDVAVFECQGRLTVECADAFRQAVQRQPQVTAVVLDLKALSDVDAAGLGALASMRNWAEATGREFRLMNLTPRVEKLLALTGLKQAFKIISAREMLDLWCRFLHRGPCSASAPFKQAAGF